MIKLCENCKKEIKLFPSKVKAYTNRQANKHFFCSKKCYQDWWIKNMIEIRENHPKWKGGNIKKECKFCGKSFSKRRRGKDRKYLFCSKECFGKSMSGENSRWWKGGISFKPYTTDWTQDLKRAIRKRDKYTCQICGKEPAICCHHIDYDKKNCNSNNLIILCHSCHSKTNHNRDYWTRFLRNKISIINPVETLPKRKQTKI